MSNTNEQQDDASSQRAQRLAQQLRAVVLQNTTTWTDLDLTMVQLKALFFVRVFQPLTITQLATKMQMRLASASALVNRLLRMGLVARAVDPHDRRRAHLTLAPAGQHLLADLDERASVRFRKLLGQMSPAGLTALEQALDELLRIAQAANTAPAHREQLNDRR